MVKTASNQPPIIRKKGWSLKIKATLWAIAISLLPVISFSIGSYLFITEFITRYVAQARQAGVPELVETVMALEKELFGLLAATAITALFISIGTAWFASRAIRPIIKAAKASGNLVNRLVRSNISAQERLAIRDEIALIRTNLSVLEEQIPDLIWQYEANAERSGLLLQINRKIQVCVTERELLKTAVEELRLAVKADRVAVFRVSIDGKAQPENAAYRFKTYPRRQKPKPFSLVFGGGRSALKNSIQVLQEEVHCIFAHNLPYFSFAESLLQHCLGQYCQFRSIDHNLC